MRREVELGGLPIELLGLDDAHIGWHDLTVGAATQRRTGSASR